MQRSLYALGLLSLVACSPEASDSDTPSSTTETIQVEATITVSENPNNTLSALVTVETPEEATVAIAFASDDTAEQLTGTSTPGTLHELVVVGMRHKSLYDLVPVVTYTSGPTGRTEGTQFQTGKKPSGVPEFSVSVLDAEAVQPGITIVGPSSEDRGSEDRPEFIGLDEQGKIVWYYDDPDESWLKQGRDLKLMADGNLLLKTEEGLRVITIAGDAVLDLRSEDVGYRMHHDVTMLPSGNFVALVQTEREVFVEGMGTINQIGDGLLEVTPDGDVVWEWWTFDHIDAARFPTELSLWNERGSFDWTHANSIAYVDSDDALLVSLRHQDWVLSIDRTTGNLNWRAGEEGDFELVSGLWFSGQHSAYLTSDGQLSVYDNGNERSSGGEYSRGVIYQLDTTAMTAEEIFTYTVGPFTPVIGGHRILDNGNSLLCAGGVFGDPVEVVEVSPTTGEAVWTLEIEDSLLFRAQRLPSFWHTEAVP